MWARLVLLFFSAGILLAQEFDITWQKIPKNYTGENIAGLVKALLTEKDQFESTKDFFERLEKAGVQENKAYAFICEENPFRTTYDADEQVYHFNWTTETAIPITRVEKRSKPYKGMTAYGAPIIVQNSEVTIHGVIDQMFYSSVDSPGLKSPSMAAWLGLTVDLPVPKDQAKSLRSDVGFILLTNLVRNIPWPTKTLFGPRMTTPYMKIEEYYSPASKSDPVEAKGYKYSLIAHIQKVIIFRKSDRTVLLIADPKKQSRKY